MPVHLDQSSTVSRLQMEGDVDIGNALELKNHLTSALTAGREVHVRFENLTGVDVTMLQLLWAARREAQAAGLVFQIEVPVPDPVLAAMTLGGLPEFMEQQG